MNNQKGLAPIAILIICIVVIVGIWFFTQSNKEDSFSQVNTDQTVSSDSQKSTANKEEHKLFTLKSGVSFDRVIKSAKAQVLGEHTGSKKRIPVQIYAYEDHNGNGVREPDDNALGFMPVNIYDSPFSDNPISKINSTDSGWASALVEVGSPYQLIVNPVPTKDYSPTTKLIILSEKNNFAVVGFEKKQEVSFHISVFAFEDANKDSNFNYDDKNEKPLFLAPFKFYQQNESGEWDLLPNSVNSTDTGWATTTVSVKYPYKVKVEAGDLNNLTPSNKELVISNKDATLVYPYIIK